MMIITFKNDQGEFEQVGTNFRIPVSNKTINGAVKKARKMKFHSKREFTIENMLGDILYKGV